MKAPFLKFLPIAAAVLLATSCSKDDNDNVPETQSGRDGVHTVSTTGIPFTIRVNTGRSLKKMAYENGTEVGSYQPKFEQNDEDKLTMIIKDGDDVIGNLTLDDAKTATFSGNLTQQPSSNASLTAEISVSGSKNSSNESLADLLATCAHTFLGKFQYGEAEVDLTDQNAYLAISMSPCCEHEIKINTTDYTVKDGRIWIAIPSDADVTSTGLGSEISKEAEEVSPGTIYTVARQYFSVADGKKVYFSKGNLQYNPKQNQWQFAPTQYSLIGGANTNISADYDGWIDLFGWGTWLDRDAIEKPYETQTDDATKYVWSGASAIGSEWETLTGGNNDDADWSYLFQTRDNASEKYGVAQVAGVNGLIILPDEWTDPKPNNIEFQSGGGGSSGSQYYATLNTYTAADWSKMEANGAVFLPAAGSRYGMAVYAVGVLGYYWSSSADGGGRAWGLRFRSDYVTPLSFDDRYFGQSVRLVRPL